MWDLPESGIEPVSPALADGFFTPEPPGKPCYRVSLGESSVLLKWRATVQHYRDPSPVLEEPDGAVTLARGSAAVASACRSYQNGWLTCLGSCGPLSLRDAPRLCHKLQKDRAPKAWSLQLPVTLACPHSPLPPRWGGAIRSQHQL